MILSDFSAIRGDDVDIDPACKRDVDVVSNAEEVKPMRSRVPPLSRLLLPKPKSRFVDRRHQVSPLYVNIVQDSATQRSPSAVTDEGGMPSSKALTTRSAAAGGAAEVEDDDDDLPAKYRKRKIGVWVLLEWIASVMLITTMVCTLTLSTLKHQMMQRLHLWKWCLMIFVVLCGRLVSSWGISILVFFVEKNFMLRKRVLYFVYGLRQSVQKCLCLGQVVLAWNLILDPRLERSTKYHKALWYVTRLLASFLVATVMWLLNILLVKVMASTFHVNTFFDRIQESIFHQYVLKTLSGRPIMEIQNNMTDERNSSKSFSNGNMAKVIFRSAEITRRKGVQMLVEEMNILTTVFLQLDNEKVYYPNTKLATKPISNFYRSPDMGDSVEFTVDVSTPVEKIGSLKDRIAKYLESKPQHWHAQFSVEVVEIEKMNDMKMGLYVLHTMSHQNMGEKSTRRSNLVLEMKKIFEELDIKYRLLPQEVHVKFVGSSINQIPLQR